MIRICPERDAICPHGMKCQYAASAESKYRCLPGWRELPANYQRNADDMGMPEFVIKKAPK